jgi:putative zinc- or iron-chelating protein
MHPEHGDNLADYDCEWVGAGLAALKHKANGDCVYLDRSRGCTIWDRRPVICREFDCAAIYLKFTPGQRRAYLSRGFMRPEVLKRGAQLLASGYLPKED